jgi:hypothetical protein
MNDYITCPCYSKQHLKTRKRSTLQNLLDKDTRNNFYLKFVRNINKLKRDLLLKDDETV